MKLNKRKLFLSAITPLIMPYKVYLKNKANKGDRLIILAYHGIEDIPIKNYYLAEGNISATTTQFEEHLKFISKYFNVINFKILHEQYISQNKFPKNGLIITFDDGYRNNYTYAFPLLKKYKLTATVFLATDYIGSKKMFWFDELSFRIFNSKKNKIDIMIGEEKVELNILTYDDKRYADLKLKQLLKKVPNTDRISKLEEIFTKLGAVNESNQNRYVLNWEEINEMHKYGIEFGSHSKTHPILSNQNDEDVKNEIFWSKKIIEDKLGECIVFSYPNGGEKDFSLREKNMIEKAGYKYAVSYIHNISYFQEELKYSLPRIHVERETSKNILKINTLWPELS